MKLELQHQETQKARFIRYITTTDNEKKKEPKDVKELRFQMRLLAYDSVFLEDSQWYVRTNHSDDLWQTLFHLSPKIQNLLQSSQINNFPLSDIPNDLAPSKSLRSQYCIICCKRTAGPWTRIRSIGLSEMELGNFTLTVNPASNSNPKKIE